MFCVLSYQKTLLILRFCTCSLTIIHYTQWLDGRLTYQNNPILEVKSLKGAIMVKALKDVVGKAKAATSPVETDKKTVTKKVVKKKTAPVKTRREIKHPNVVSVLRAKHTKEGPLTSDNCENLIGWVEEHVDEDWKQDFVLKDLFGKKIRLTNNSTNRPFKRSLADRYANEHLRGKWRLNLETIVISNMGQVLQGQHRFVGFILAEQMRKIDTKKWGSTPLSYEVLLGYGVPNNLETADTFDLGSKRSLSDVLYRRQKFGKSVTDKQQRKISQVLAGAVRLVWLRCGGKQVSFAPHFPHTEAVEFYGKHPAIIEAVGTIVALDDGDEGNEKSISSLISLSYASALYYLMREVNSEKADLFWSRFSTAEDLKKGSPILSLRNLLIKSDASSGGKRDEIIGAVIKSWLLFIKNKNGMAKDIKVAKRKDGDRFILAEFPRIGGLDSDVDIKVELTQHQLVILSILKKEKKEITYKHLTEATGLQLGTLSNALMEETKAGKQNPHSLASRGLVRVNQYEPQEGEKISPYWFSLKNGKA